jgi:hypothetical protein
LLAGNEARRDIADGIFEADQLDRGSRLYRDSYFDFNVSHFHEKLREEHSIELSYTLVKNLLQGAGLVAKDRSGTKHR